MVTGAGTSNRIGIKGEEDLGSGYKIKFVLENGFDADTGAEATEGLAFSREATLQIVSIRYIGGRALFNPSAPTAEASICWVTSTRSEQVFGSSATKHRLRQDACLPF